MLYPLKFTPVYKENVWGGDLLKQLYGRDIPSKNTGESWDVACHPNGMSIVANGSLAGRTLLSIFEEYKEELLGANLSHLSKFPLLVKIIDAKERLSLQVHPDDAYAQVHENGELGKCEMWYVLYAKKGAKLAVGLKSNTTKEILCDALVNGNLAEHINEIPVQIGDVLNIPAGLLHAIEEDIVIAEVQQNSDTVYRVFDWNRFGLDGKPRDLHIKQAIDVIDFNCKIKKEITRGLSIEKNGNKSTYFIANSYFAIEVIEMQLCAVVLGEQKMVILMCLDGEFIVKAQDSRTLVKKGESILIPASVNGYTLEGKSKILKAYIPDIEEDFIIPLKSAGYSDSEIETMVAID